jgi:hypothetical protein
MHLNDVEWEGVDWFMKVRIETASYKHGDELSGSVKGRKFLN